MKDSEKIIRQSEIIKTDANTGVMETMRTNVYVLPKEPPYIKFYLQDIEKLYALPRGSHRVIFELLKKLDYGGLINLNISIKRRIIKNVGWKTVASLDNYISEHLTKKNLFTRVDVGGYAPNPSLFGRWSWEDICKRRTGWIKISYDGQGKKVTTNFTRE